MARIFITPREIDFISDLTKEITKDVRDQKIYYYRVREELTNVHDVYEEAPEKVFDPPIEVKAMVEWEPEEVRTNRFGAEEFYTISVYIQMRDLIDRGFEVQTGDYFSYGTIFFEITSVIVDKTIFGQIEHKTGFKITGKQAREGQIDKFAIGPTSEDINEEDSVQEEFVQKRGLEENRLGPTGDKRALIEDGKLEPPEEGPAEVKKDTGSIKSSFYGD